MEDLQDALQSILSDPEQMARVAALAESLGLKPPDAQPNGETSQNCHSKPCPEQGRRESEESVLSSLLSDKNGFYLEKAMGLLSASSGGENRILTALRPTLGPEGQTRVDRALRAARLSRLAGALLTQRRGARV